jgi:transaldolase
MTQAALAGAHVATLPFKVLQQMAHHPLTTSGIKQFRADWEKAREALASNNGKAKAEVKETAATKPGA